MKLDLLIRNQFTKMVVLKCYLCFVKEMEYFKKIVGA